MQNDAKNKGKALSTEIDAKIAELEKKIESPATEQTIKDWLQTCARFHHYSYRNTFWLWTQSVVRKTVITHCASFTTWNSLKNEAGEAACVRRGEHGYQVIFHMQHKIYETGPDGNKVVALDESGKEKSYITYGVGYVFDVAQTNAREIGAYREPPYFGKEVNVSSELVEALAIRISDKLLVPVKFESSCEIAAGWYKRSSHDITINTRLADTPTKQMSVLLHELGHAVMHNATCHGDSMSRELREGQAEAFAYAACSFFGVEPPGELYIKEWISDQVSLSDVMRNIGNTVRDTFGKLELQELVNQQRAAVTTGDAGMAFSMERNHQ